ncbi:MAG: hypothetical protein JKY45_04845 [Emcibacter sp.]|nr:hypothetical protein [Emcibacter sp.]
MPDIHHANEPDLANSGRVKGLIHSVAQDILYSADFDSVRRNELVWMSRIDLAHLVMLRETGILRQGAVTPLIAAILNLRETGFDALQNLPMPRGTYMLYESYLIDLLGVEVGGVLQTARSRNDLGATLQRMRHRVALADLTETLLDLEAALLDQAHKHLHQPFPLFTHYQAAQVTTLGQYFLAITASLQRGHAVLETLFDNLAVCPLGAGAIGGTGFEIDTNLTATLLGFETGPDNSIDAIASRDHVQRTLSECGTLGGTVSRLAHDLQLWTTQEFGLLEVDDILVGISSMMPQKRNIYLTENVKGKLATALGATQSAAVAMHSTPFSNSISVGTEACKHLWPAMDDTVDALRLITLLVEGLRPVTERITARISDGFCTATALADALVRHNNLSFRDAHHCVGRLVRDMQDAGETDLAKGLRQFQPGLAEVLAHVDLSPDGVISSQKYGGGPAPAVQSKLCSKAKAEHSRMSAELAEKRQVWVCAETRLDTRALAEASATKWT